jgi:o-succinylbenzoate synthase
MRVSYCFYELTPYHAIKAKQTHPVRKGALLRFDFLDGSTGYADCHPWEELGDVPLVKQLEWLSQGVTTQLTHRSLYFGSIDAEARKRGVSLFENLKIPESHYLVSNFQEASFETLLQFISKGFSRIKLKLRGTAEEISKLKEWIKLLSHTDCLLRLDFNHQLTPQTFSFFCQTLGDDLRKIDFCEDPFPFSKESWSYFYKTYGLSLACDYHSHRNLREKTSIQTAVLKPAVQDERHYRAISQQLVVTSYLDHPLGQTTAAYVASQFNTSICGLISHLNYAPNAFSEQFSLKGAQLEIPLGTGFGFDELLGKQVWIKL